MQALRLAETSGKPITQVERELGLIQGMVAHWWRELNRHGAEAFPGGSALRCIAAFGTRQRLAEITHSNAGPTA